MDPPLPRPAPDHRQMGAACTLGLRVRSPEDCFVYLLTAISRGIVCSCLQQGRPIYPGMATSRTRRCWRDVPRSTPATQVTRGMCGTSLHKLVGCCRTAPRTSKFWPCWKSSRLELRHGLGLHFQLEGFPGHNDRSISRYRLRDCHSSQPETMWSAPVFTTALHSLV